MGKPKYQKGFTLTTHPQTLKEPYHWKKPRKVFVNCFIFNVICARLYSEIPNIQIITCHDEIYFEEKYKDKVEKIWTEELKKVYKTLPSIEYSEEGDVCEAEI